MLELRDAAEAIPAVAPPVAPAPLLSSHLYRGTDSTEPPRAYIGRKEAAEEFIVLLDDQLKKTKERTRQGRLHFEWARVLEAPLGQFAEAVVHLKKANELLPNHEGIISSLRRLCLVLEEYEAALPWFDQELALTGAVERKAALYFEKGVLLEGPLGRPQEARKAYEAAYQLAPVDPSILRAVARARRRDKAWNDVDQVLEREVQHAGDDATLRAARLAERARLTETKRKDSATSANLYQLAFDAAENFTVALGDLERLHALLQRPAELAQALEERVRLAQSKEVRKAALVQLARVKGGALGDHAAAATALERAYAEQPEDQNVLEELTSLYRRLGHSEGLLSALARLEAKEALPIRKLELRLRIGRLYEESLKDDALAAAAYENARKISPTHPDVVDTLIRFYSERQAWERLISVYSGVAEHAKLTARRANAQTTIADLCEKELNDRERAATHHQKALALVPDQAASFRSLTRLYSELGRKTELLELYERGVELAPDDETAFALLLFMGRLLEDELRDPARAVEQYLRILARAPEHLGALMALERAAAHAGNDALLLDALTREAALLGGPRQVELLHRAGEVAESRLGDDAKAIELYQAVQKLDGRFAPTLSSLRRVYLRLGRYPAALEIYQKELSLAASPAEKAELHSLIAALSDAKLGRRDVAASEYRKALEQDRAHAAARRALTELLTETGQFEELAQLIAREAEQETVPAKKADAFSRLAEVQEYRLNKPQEALKAYERLIALGDTPQAAFDAKIRLHAVLGQYKELAKTLDDLAESTSDQWLRTSSRLRAAEVYRDDLAQPESAIQRYELVRSEHPGHTEALLNLENLYAEVGKKDALVGIYEDQVRYLRQSSQQVAALRELQRLSGPTGETSGQEREILARDPTDARALEQSVRSALRAGSEQALAEADSRLAEDSARPRIAALHALRLGEFLEAKNQVQALLAFRKALSHDSESLAAARGISRLAETIGNADLLREAAENEISVTEDPERAARLLVLAAKRLESEGNFAEALAAFERALLVYPNSRTAGRRYYALASSRALFDRLVTVLSDAAGRATDKDVRAEHWMAVARVYAGPKGDHGAGLTALLRVEKEQPNHVGVLLELGELYAKDGQHAPAAERLVLALTSELSSHEKVAVELRLAQLYHEHLERPADAERSLRAVLELEPQNQDALRRLLHLQMKASPAEARVTAKAWADATKGPDRAEALTTWGRLARDTGSLEEARTAFEEAVRLVGVAPHGPAREFAELLRDATALRGQGGFDGYAKALEDYLRHPSSNEGTAAAYLELGRIYLDELNDVTRGLPALERGMRSTPKDVPLRVEYVERLRKAGRDDVALTELRGLLVVEPARPETWRDLVEVLDRLGQNAESHLALGPLALLGGASELQKAQWRERKPRPAWVAEGSLTGPELEHFGDAVPSEALALLGQLGALAHKIFPGAWERLGLSPREKIGARSNHPLRPIFERALRAFGTLEVELYSAPDYDGPVRLLLSDPLGLVLPGSFAGISEADQVFTLVRFLAPMARGTFLADALSADEFSDLLVAAVRLVEPRFGNSKTGDAELSNLGKRIAKALPWLSKGRFEDVARRYAEAHPTGYLPPPDALRRSALETALIISDDVSPMTLLARPEGQLLGTLDGSSKEAQLRLLSAWLSEPGLLLRKRIGLL